MEEKKKKRKKGISNTQRTLKYLKDRGMVCGMVERFLAFAGPHGKRQDLFGFIDIIALDMNNCRILAVQSCGGSQHAEHKKKVIEDCKEAFENWIRCDGDIWLISWSKRKVKRGGKAIRWIPRIEDLNPYVEINLD